MKYNKKYNKDNKVSQTLGMKVIEYQQLLCMKLFVQDMVAFPGNVGKPAAQSRKKTIISFIYLTSL